MPHHRGIGQAGIGLFQDGDESGQPLILGTGKGMNITAFQFDADGKVIAAFPPLKAGHPRMPGPLEKRDILHHFTIAPDQDMGGDPEPLDLGEEGMPLRRQGIGEQPVDPGSPELPRRQADGVDDDEFRRHPRRTRILIGGRHPCCDVQPAGGVDVHKSPESLEVLII